MYWDPWRKRILRMKEAKIVEEEEMACVRELKVSLNATWQEVRDGTVKQLMESEEVSVMNNEEKKKWEENVFEETVEMRKRRVVHSYTKLSLEH